MIGVNSCRRSSADLQHGFADLLLRKVQEKTKASKQVVLIMSTLFLKERVLSFCPGRKGLKTDLVEYQRASTTVAMAKAQIRVVANLKTLIITVENNTESSLLKFSPN